MDNVRRNLRIKINQGEEYKIRLGCAYEKEGLFYDSYQRAAELLRETLRIADGIRKKADSRDPACAGTEDDNAYEFSNNIIAFCGGRGEGKSSALRTFAHALECIHSGEQGYSAEDIKMFWKLPLGEYSFEILPVIDPTMRRTQDSFMRVILSRMFVQIREQFGADTGKEATRLVSGTYHKKVGRDQIESILTAFRECYACLDTLSRQPNLENRYDDLEEIASLGDSGNLRSKFRQLAKAYLAVMSNDRSKDPDKSYLILQIDDADLNISQAYDILEDIRLYCLVPEVIILMATEMQQLQQIIEQHYIRDFDLMLKHEGRGASEAASPLLRECRSMAMRYIDKVVPGSRQIHLPQIDAVLKDDMANLSVSYLIPGLNGKEGNPEDALEEVNKVSADYQECLLGWLYRKTGIALIKPGTYRHNFLPGHLRELTHFLAFFGKMESLDPEYNIVRIHSLLRANEEETNGLWIKKREGALRAKERWAGNLQGLEQYFLKSWTGLHLDLEGQNVIRKIEHTADTLKPQVICEFCDGLARKLSVESPAFSAPDAIYTKYSYAFVMAKLNSISQALKQEGDYCVIYALRFYYMLLIYKKLLAFTGDDARYEQMIQDVKYESWIPDYRWAKKEFSYGRFEVNLFALGKLRSEFDINGDREELLGRLRKMLYVITPSNIGRPVQKDDISEPLDNPEDSTGDHDRTMFDWSYYLMSLIVGGGGNCALPPGDTPEDVHDWEITVDQYDMALQFLLNWDIQHHLEVNCSQEGSSGDGGDTAEGLSNWIIRYCNSLIESMKKQKYIMWMVSPDILSCDNVEFQIPTLPKGFDVLCYGNYEYAKRRLVDFCSELKEKMRLCESDGEPKPRVWNSLNEIVSEIKRRQNDFAGCSILDGVSVLVDEILDQWGEVSVRAWETDAGSGQLKSILNSCQRLVNLLDEKANISVLDGIFTSPKDGTTTVKPQLSGGVEL